MTLVQLEQSACALGTALRQVRTVEEYLKARDGLEDDEVALRFLEKQARVKAAIHANQLSGATAASDLDELSEGRQEIRRKVEGYLDAQEKLRVLFRAVDGELSLLLGFGFAAMAGKTGCC